jgi:hypothetical protein
MGNNSVKTLISLLLLTLFIGIKGLSYHPMTHAEEGDQVKCELCAFTYLNEVTSFNTVSETAVAVLYVEGPAYELPGTFTVTYFKESSFPVLFGRPPPAIS